MKAVTQASHRYLAGSNKTATNVHIQMIFLNYTQELPSKREILPPLGIPRQGLSINLSRQQQEEKLTYFYLTSLDHKFQF